ncbi:AraC family transcriptional regulator [Pseudonocardia spinosispora]|uniref:AraC family transcriptional regulator n=1 Tax=Pseudonocardia spinosispora TaxID=103441 RepID=UPI0003FCEDCA|nr:helix-turn-helix domain-containing protein [Pseudonocardia spinosispora]
MDTAEVSWALRRPHPALHALVSRYIGYRQRDVSLAVHRGLPGRHLTLIISLEEPIRLVDMPGSPQRPDHWQGLVSGLHAGPALIGQDRNQSGIHVELNPLGVRTLLGVSAAELSGWIVDLAQLPRPDLASLPDQLRAAPDWATRFDLLDRALIDSASRSSRTGPADEIGWAWRRLVTEGGAVPIARLAEDIGWSRRHFSERFSREVGLSPKQAARVVRFGRATEMLRRLPPGGLAEVASTCGYFDQAHLSNEFRSMAGCTPRTWLVEELPFLQDPEAFGEQS